ncbi:MAG: hypothetical protein GY768_18315 [Planctomycetaceae bacterium]|nr:hypothetical protein [Planctomycetaceae bacterium]
MHQRSFPTTDVIFNLQLNKLSPWAHILLWGLFLVPTNSPAQLTFDKQLGHYKDLSYAALSEEGLSWEQRASLFGGETAHYEELSDSERKTKTDDLQVLLARIEERENQRWADPKLLSRVEEEVRNWLNQQAAIEIANSYVGADVQRLRTTTVGLLRGYEIFGDQNYLKSALRSADVILKAQWAQGHWPWGDLSADFVRIQDGFNNEPFWIMLYAHKVSGDPKYLSSARRCADLLLRLQRNNGGWPDQWSFSGKGSGHTGVRDGVSFNDNATNSCFQMMIMMYHLTGDRKYIAKLNRLGDFIAEANLGEGDVVGWCEQYHDNGTPVRARQYEIELPYPRAFTRGVGPLLIWLYLIDGNESHMDLLRRAYAWHEHVRQQEIAPQVLGHWRAMSEAWTPSHHILSENFLMEYQPGWPDAWLPDGSNWGRVLSFKLMAWNPLTVEQKNKYGKLIDHDWPPVSRLAELATSRQNPPRDYNMYVFCHSGMGNSLSEIRRALLEHKRGGRASLQKYYSNTTRYTPDQYLQARIDAAHRVLDLRNRRLAYPYLGRPGYSGISTMSDFRFIGSKGRWYGNRNSKWGQAFQQVYPSNNVVWYQWQLVYDAKLARGEISPDAAARGGRGLESVATQTHLDSWDVLGEWGMACHELENHFDLRVKSQQKSSPPLQP